MRGFCARFVGLHVGAETVLVGNVANLPKHSVLVLISVAALNLHWCVAFLLLPLLVSFVIDDFVSVLVRIKLVVLVVFMML